MLFNCAFVRVRSFDGDIQSLNKLEIERSRILIEM